MNKQGYVGMFIGMMVVWFVLRMDALVPTMVGALIGGTVGNIVGGLTEWLQRKSRLWHWVRLRDSLMMAVLDLFDDNAELAAASAAEANTDPFQVGD